jgi:ubiquinone biosynthesis monooxygenase Coq7
MKDLSIDSMIRVNHAGEYGAMRIYEGQKAILGNSPVAPLLDHMLDQEKEHFDRFDETLKRRRVRPTALSPLWHVAGFALGAGSALLGKRAAMACTVAVETVIDEHYQAQLEALKDKPEEAPLRVLIEKCHEEELEHKDLSLQEEAEKMIGYNPFTTAVKAASRLAIFLSERI